MAKHYRELHAAAIDLKKAIKKFSETYDEIVDSEDNGVLANDNVEAAMSAMEDLGVLVEREIVADAFEEGELHYISPTPAAPEGSENVHKSNIFLGPKESLNNFRDAIGRSSPVRMTSPL
jgi:hypothetical protein